MNLNDTWWRKKMDTLAHGMWVLSFLGGAQLMFDICFLIWMARH